MGISGSKDTADLVNTAANLRRYPLPERALASSSSQDSHNDASAREGAVSPSGGDVSYTNNIVGGDPIAEEKLEVFWTIPTDATHVFSLIQPDDIRRLRRLQPRNLARFLRVIVSKMQSLSHKDDLHANEQKYALNCIRILTRMLPVLFEDPTDSFLERVWWENCLPTPDFEDETYKQQMADLEERFRASLRGRQTQQEKREQRRQEHQQQQQQQNEDDASSEENTDDDEDEDGQDEGAPPLPPYVPCTWQWEPFSKKAAREQHKKLKKQREQRQQQQQQGSTTTSSSGGESEGRVRVQSGRVSVTASLENNFTEVPNDPTSEDEPLGRVLVHTVMHLLFAPGFTVDQGAWTMFRRKFNEEEARHRQSRHTGEEDEETDDENGSHNGKEDDNEPIEATADVSEHDQRTLSNAVWPSILWAGGVGFPKITPPKSGTYDSNRVEALRLLQAIMSQPLYKEADPHKPFRSRFIDVAVSPRCPFAPTLFYSLLNAALVYDPVGWGLPYGAAVMADTAEGLMDMSLQVLLLLLDYAALLKPEEARLWNQYNRDDNNESERDSDDSNEPPPYTVPNTYRALLSGLQDERDFKFIFDRISDLLANVHRSDSSMLPYSVKQIHCHQELLVLLWKLLDDNDDFLGWVLRTGSTDVCRIVTPMLYFMWTGRANAAKVGLIHLCTFILLLLSGHRNFAVALNKKFTDKLPTDLPLFEGNHADLLVIVLHKLVVNASEKLSTIYSCFLTIIANISPYIKSFSLVASVKLLNLMELFADPVFVLSHPNHHNYVEQLLDTMNNIIQYQYEGNGHVIYGILRLSRVFENLSMLPKFLPKVQAIVRRKALQASQAASRTRERIHEEESASVAGAAVSGPPGSSAADSDLETESGVATRGENGPAERKATETTSTTKVTSAQRSGVVPGTESTLPQNNAADKRSRNRQGAAAGADHEEVQDEDEAELLNIVSSDTFVPTREWLQEWYPNMLSQLGTPLRLLQHLSPQVENFIEESEGTADEQAVLDFIRNTTLVGLLPVPHAVVMRRYQPNKYTALWFTTFLWGVIFLRNQEYPVFDSRQIRLFSITLV
eukprot:gb/GECG01014937.1/.p1 GENE.gb/GECG01014937.1/~~gb/GECG01014937.1/.p1  ORF type:complete len:1072 (+),score=149.30 gb/GECG01014937.1/:1-3216(+)